jgi:hypothetical protein
MDYNISVSNNRRLCKSHTTSYKIALLILNPGSLTQVINHCNRRFHGSHRHCGNANNGLICYTRSYQGLIDGAPVSHGLPQ